MQIYRTQTRKTVAIELLFRGLKAVWVKYGTNQGEKKGEENGTREWERESERKGDSVRLAFHKWVHVATSCRASRGLSWWQWLAVEAGRLFHDIPVASDVAQGMIGEQVSKVGDLSDQEIPGFTHPKLNTHLLKPFQSVPIYVLCESLGVSPAIIW